MCLKPDSTSKARFAELPLYLRLIGQEGDVDLRQGLDGFGSPTLHHLVEQRVGAGCNIDTNEHSCHISTVVMHAVEKEPRRSEEQHRHF